ncbi:restriction endonuclease subunit S [Eggerthella lenta]|uniref:restriction endonuclease subunit S n=1 Tax=Eggerthella lenta TaxID=84112 RepID=UPI001FBAB3DD|nr:restriction endonuclease subunit S [Eggerthella lenta]GKG85416.1 restriction endonuclease subunit S [Eggerthella lenta]GKG86644.1 restriction endonuclease subunit S [Eggerthella lenta]
MSEQKRNVPKLRFPGFTDAWEQRKLGEMVNVRSGQDYKHLSEGDIPVYGTGGYMLSVDKALSYSKDAIGIGRKGTIDKPYLLRAPFWTVDTLFYAIPKAENDLDFIHSIFQKIEWRRRDESTGVPSLSKTAVTRIDVFSPSSAEQALIGSFFRDLDDLITLHQRKLDHLKLQKRGLLQKMFPRDGSDGPEIRFPGFTDAWEQRKLGEMVNVRSGQDYKHLSEGDIPVYGTGGYMLSVDKALSYSKDAIGIGRKGTIDKPYLLRAPFWTVDTLFYAIPKAENDLDFIHSIFQKIEWRRRDESTGVPSLSKTAVTRIDVFSPSSAEQALIGSFFRDLDDLITLHQRKLDHLKLQKKALLQQMFI